MNALLLDRLKATQPELKDFKPSSAPAPEAPAASAAPAAEAAPTAEPPEREAAAAAEKEAAAAAAEEAPEEEIKDTDSVEQQLAKLRKAQKKTLSRIDKITSERDELRRKLEEAQGAPVAEAITSAPALKHVQSVDDLKKEDAAIADWVKTLTDHTKEGYSYRTPNGEEVTLSPEEVVNQIVYWTDVRASQVPTHRQFLETRDRTRQETAEKFKPWTEKKGFTSAKTDVEKAMQNAQSLLPDYDLAVHERALGRLVLSDEYELVPKRKAALAGVESAPARKPEAPPVAPPSSGGPPIKPAGSGPDVESLRQKMLKEPGNHAAVQAYLKAKLTASRAA